MYRTFRGSFLVAIIVGVGALSGCGINDIPTYDEEVKAAWGQVQNQYQRREDLIPNLVATVKGYAAQERETLTAVTEARARVGQMNVSSDIVDNPEALKAFEANQSALSSALSRLMVVVERYPDLKSNQNFLALQAQLEGTENRISVARRDFVRSVQKFNTEIRTLPGSIWHGMLYSDLEVRESFQASEGADRAPQVEF